MKEPTLKTFVRNDRPRIELHLHIEGVMHAPEKGRQVVTAFSSLFDLYFYWTKIVCCLH